MFVGAVLCVVLVGSVDFRWAVTCRFVASVVLILWVCSICVYCVC